MIPSRRCGGMIPMINMQLGEIIIGGVGAGLYGMLVFVRDRDVHRRSHGRPDTPEYVGKKIEAKEVKMAMLAILCLPLSILGFTAAATVLPFAVSSIANPGPHGFSEILYAYTSATANNGSAFGGLTGNTLWYNITLGLAMLMGRFLVIVPALAIAGSLAAKKTVPASAGNVPHARYAVRRASHQRHPGCRRPHILPCTRSWPDRRTSRDDQRHVVLIRAFGVQSMEMIKNSKRAPVTAMLDPKIVIPALGSAFRQARPENADQKNPVMFVLEIVTILTTILLIRDVVTGAGNVAFGFQITLWLWFTILFANFAEAIAEGRGKAQAASLRRTRTESQAKLLTGSDIKSYKAVPGTSLKVGDVVLVEAGDTIPSDGEVIEGVASVNEAAITGEIRARDP